MVPLTYTVCFLLMLLSLSSVAFADDLFVTGGTAATGTTLYRFNDAGTGSREALGRIRITSESNANFDVAGLVFDFDPELRPLGSLFVLVGPNNGAVSNLVLEIPAPYNLQANAAFVEASIYASVFEPAVGLAITDTKLLLSWRIGESVNEDDDLISIVPRGGQTLFPQPNRFDFNSGIRTNGELVGYDFRRDQDQNQLVHMIFFDPDASPFHSYFVLNLSTGQASFRSTQVELQPGSKCFGGSMNPNVDGEFWCIEDTSFRVGRNTLIRIDLEAAMEVGRQSVDVTDISAIAFSYDTTQAPSSSPTSEPSSAPSMTPTGAPSSAPSTEPSSLPSTEPSSRPSSAPSEAPSSIPSEFPSAKPSATPSRTPSESPTAMPSSAPAIDPSSIPSEIPSAKPSSSPSGSPSEAPTSVPSTQPSGPESSPPSLSAAPSEMPSSIPSEEPSAKPSASPSLRPSESPTASPSSQPSSKPSVEPSAKPSSQPSSQPSGAPSSSPTVLAANACTTNQCTFLGGAGARMNTILFGTCISRCVPDFLEGVYLAAGFSCGACP